MGEEREEGGMEGGAWAVELVEEDEAGRDVVPVRDEGGDEDSVRAGSRFTYRAGARRLWSGLRRPLQRPKGRRRRRRRDWHFRLACQNRHGRVYL